MEISPDLYAQICFYDNLFLAFENAKNGKTMKPYVIEFEKNLEENLWQLRNELLYKTYQPKPLKTFILRDPKTRKISKSDFRDRIVHHALCNIIEPLFDKIFIYDNCANRKGKGTLFAIKRFEKFRRKVTSNFTSFGFCFKADIKQYFEKIDHDVLIEIIKRKIRCQKTIQLIRSVIENKVWSERETRRRDNNKGMPLGNLTS